MAKRRKFREEDSIKSDGTSVESNGVDTELSRTGERIAQVRGKQTQGDLARELGVHVNTLRRYESGARLPDGEFLLAMAKTRQVNPTWLLLGLGDQTLAPTSEVATRQAALTHEEVENACKALYRAISYLPDTYVAPEAKSQLLRSVFETGLLLAKQSKPKPLEELIGLFATLLLARRADVDVRDS